MQDDVSAASQAVYAALNQMGIAYEVVHHPAANSTEEADAYIEGHEGVRSKTLFLCNRKKNAYYLLVMDDGKRLDMKQLGGLLDEKGMQFASAAQLQQKMALTPGVVSLFGLLNNEEHDIRVCLDQEMLSAPRISFHPNDNRQTLFMDMADVFRFVNILKYSHSVVDLT